MSPTLTPDAPDDEALGTRVGRALDRRPSPAMSIDLEVIRRGAHRRQIRRRVVSGVCCAAVVAGAVTVLARRDEPSSAADEPTVPVETPAIGAAALLPARYGEPASVAAYRAGIPRGVDLPRVDVWQSGTQRIVVRTFVDLAGAPIADVPVTEAPPTTAAAPPDVDPESDQVEVGEPVQLGLIEQLAADQWAVFLTADRERGDTLILRGMTKAQAEAELTAMTRSGDVLAPTGFELIEHAEAAPWSDPGGWFATVGFGRESADVWTSVWSGAPGRDSIELESAWTVGAIRTVDGRDVLEAARSEGGTSIIWRDPIGVFVSVSSWTQPIGDDVLGQVELVDQPEFEAIAASISARQSEKPLVASGLVDGTVLSLRGSATDVVVCIDTEGDEQCAADDNASMSGPPTASAMDTLVDGEWVIFGVYELGGPDDDRPNIADDRYTTDGHVVPVEVAEQDGRLWWIVRVPADSSAITTDPSNDVSGVVGSIARPVVVGILG